MDCGLDDDRLRAHANGCNLLTMDLGRATRDLAPATMGCGRATTGLDGAHTFEPACISMRALSISFYPPWILV